jgi:putative nucleotidyltransferase with HDIG domain
MFHQAILTVAPSGQRGGRKKDCLQLLRLASKLTEARQGAFLDLDQGADLLIGLKKRDLPLSYREAAREVAQNPVPLLFNPKDQRSFSPILVVPVHQQGNLTGVLILGDRPKRPLDQDDLMLVTLLAENPSLVPEDIVQKEGHSIFLLESIKALLMTLEARDHYTGQHSSRVTEMALHFGHHLGVPPKDLESLKTACYLHDLGKVGISDAILLKPGPLTPKERRIVETHPLIGVKIIESLGLKPREKEIILYHHERWDGRGYPHGLAGEQIPFLGRLIALPDVFDALTSDRPYRRRLPLPEALAEIRAQAGSQFDPHLAREFIDMISSQVCPIS